MKMLPKKKKKSVSFSWAELFPLWPEPQPQGAGHASCPSEPLPRFPSIWNIPENPAFSRDTLAYPSKSPKPPSPPRGLLRPSCSQYFLVDGTSCPALLNQGRFYPQGTLDNVWARFWLSPYGRLRRWNLVGRGQMNVLPRTGQHPPQRIIQPMTSVVPRLL